MNHIKKMLSLLTVPLLLAACSGSETSSQDPSLGLNKTTISGQVQQGNVVGATVFLDLNGDGVKQAGEPAATSLTAADGKFVLPLTADDLAKLRVAGATAKIVSDGGTDPTGLTAGLLVSDLPVIATETETKNITPLTTLVAKTLDPAKKEQLKGVLKSLGHTDDNALIETSTPAAIALTKSCEAALSSIQKSAAGKTKDVIAKVTLEAAAKMGDALATKTAAEITDTAALSTTLSVAAGTAITDNHVELGGLDDVQVAGMVSAIETSCKGVADLVKTGSGGSLSTSEHSKTESEIMDAVGAEIKHTVDTANTEVETHGVK
jgi:hypothetical protein